MRGLPSPAHYASLFSIHDTFLKLCPPGKYYKEATLTTDQVSSLPALRVSTAWGRGGACHWGPWRGRGHWRGGGHSGRGGIWWQALWRRAQQAWFPSTQDPLRSGLPLSLHQSQRQDRRHCTISQVRG